MSDDRTSSHGAGRIAPSSLARIALPLLFATGCAGLPWSSQGAPDVHPIKVQRAKEAGKHFSDQRDRSEFEAAKFAWRHDDAQGCRELLEKLLKRNPGHREAGLLMAELLLVEEQPEEAREQLKRVLAANPNDAEALHAMGLLLEAGDKLAEAQAFFDRAAQAAPHNHEFRMSRDAVAKRLQRPAEDESSLGDDSFQLVSDEAPPEADPAAPTVEGPSSRRTETLAPSTKSASESWLELADAAIAAGQPEIARFHFRQARESAPDDAAVPLSAAILAIKRDELELAVEIAETGIKSFPDSAGLYRTLGAARYRLGEYKSAKASFERAISLDKSHPLSYFLLGSTLKKLDQSEAAEAYFRQAERLDPRYSARR
jgi:tetratricopeptide (TPR) repeat protein